MRLFFILLLLLAVMPTQAQRPKSELEQRRAEFAALIRELHQATAELKASLEQELALYETGAARAKERLDKTTQLYEAGLVGKRELDKDREGLATAEQRLDDVKVRLDAVSKELADMAAQDPEKMAREMIKQTPKRERTPQGRIYYVRFIIVGEIAIYDYTGAVRGRVVKYRGNVRSDTRK